MYNDLHVLTGIEGLYTHCVFQI